MDVPEFNPNAPEVLENPASAYGALRERWQSFAMPLPVWVMCELVGVPPEHYLQYRRWSDELARRHALLRDAGIDAPQREHLGAVLPMDLMSLLVVSRYQGRPLSDEELM